MTNRQRDVPATRPAAAAGETERRMRERSGGWRWGSWRLPVLLAAVGAALLLTLGTAGAQAFPPDAKSEQGDDIRTLYMVVFAVAAVVFVVVEAAIVYLVIRYRRRRADEMPEQVHGSKRVEVIWTVVPSVIVIALFVLSFIVLDEVQSSPGADEPVETIDVMGAQWTWAFRYSTPLEATTAEVMEGDAAAITLAVSDGTAFRAFMSIRVDTEHMRVTAIDGNTLTVERKIDGTVAQAHAAGAPIFLVFDGTDTQTEARLGGEVPTPVVTVPVGRNIRFNIASQDVLHSFYTPQFLYKLDAVPGRVHTMWVNVTEAGSYEAQCAEFCGKNHARMLFTVRALPPAEYDAWFQGKIPALPPPGEAAPGGLPGDPAHGQELYFANGCNVCHGDTGQGSIGPTIAQTGFTLEQEIAQYRTPRGTMPPFAEDKVSDSDVAAIRSWLHTLPLPATIVPGEGTAPQ